MKLSQLNLLFANSITTIIVPCVTHLYFG